MLANLFHTIAVKLGYKELEPIIPALDDATNIGNLVLQRYTLSKTDPETDIGVTVYFLADREDKSKPLYEIY